MSADSHSSIQIADPRAQPLVFSPDGWGEGEQAGFALSAWMGFVVMLLLGLVPWLPKHISKALPMYIGNIGNAQLFDSWRAAAEIFMSGWSSQLHLRSTLGVLAWPSYVVLVVSIFMVGVICFYDRFGGLYVCIYARNHRQPIRFCDICGFALVHRCSCFI